jgi:hypothetical protein
MNEIIPEIYTVPIGKAGGTIALIPHPDRHYWL